MGPKLPDVPDAESVRPGPLEGGAVRQMQPVLWTKGLLLSPQHLQTQDRFLEDYVDFRLSAHASFPWGFQRLEIDHEALSGGTLALSDGAGIFPDGLLFDLRASDEAPEPKPLEDHWREDRDAIDVYLGVPERRPRGTNVTTDGGDANTRYVAEAVSRRDENTGGSERPIQIARKNLRLLTDVESLDGYAVLPVARVERSSTGEYGLASRFVPPVLDVRASDYLTSIARRLVELLSARSATLSGMRRERRKGLADFGVSDVANFWLLYTVNSHLPAVRHVFEGRSGHPGRLYQVMLSLAGALTTFSTDVRPSELPAYDHADLADCFSRLDDTLRGLLETVIPANHVSLTLEPTEPSVQATALDQDRYFDASEIYLAVGGEMESGTIPGKVPQLFKVSSADRIDVLIKQALPGVELRHVPEPPSALPVKLDFEYFRLDTSGAEWDAVRRARNLAVYVPSDFSDPRLELVILLPREG